MNLNEDAVKLKLNGKYLKKYKFSEYTISHKPTLDFDAKENKFLTFGGKPGKFWCLSELYF